MNDWYICWLFTHIFTAGHFYQSFGVKGLSKRQLEWCGGEIMQDVTSIIIILLLLDSVPTAMI
jgi:hypothetical protein